MVQFKIEEDQICNQYFSGGLRLSLVHLCDIMGFKPKLPNSSLNLKCAPILVQIIIHRTYVFHK